MAQAFLPSDIEALNKPEEDKEPSEPVDYSAAKTLWAQIIADPRYQNASDSNKALLAGRFFDKHVAPLSSDNNEDVKMNFIKGTMKSPIQEPINVTPGEAASVGMVNGATLGFAPALMMQGDKEDIQNALAQSKAQHPLAYIGGGVAGGLIPAIGAAPLAGPATAGLLGLGYGTAGAGIGGAAVPGAFMGAMQGLGNSVNSPSPTLGKVAGSAALGGLTGGLATAALPLAGEGLGKLTELFSGMPTSVSRVLRETANEESFAGLPFNKQIDMLERFASDELEGNELVNVDEWLSKVRLAGKGLPSALTDNFWAYALKTASGAVLGSLVGNPILGGTMGAVVTNPSAAGIVQQSLGLLSGPVSGLAGSAARSLTGSSK